MLNNKFDLNLLLVFIQIVEAKSLAEAARRTEMSRANISIKLKQLEEALNTQLFRRTTRRIELTHQGRLLYERSLKIYREVQSVNHEMSDYSTQVKGYIRVRVPAGIGQKYLAPIFIDFLQEAPEVDLRIVFNDQIEDLIESEVDFAIKITSNPPESYRAKRICDIDWVLCCAPTYLEDQTLDTLTDLSGIKMITPSVIGRHALLKFYHQRKLVTQEIVGHLQSGNYIFLLNATLQGMGVALLPLYMVYQDLKEGRLVQVLEDYKPLGIGNALYILTTPNKYVSLASKQLMDFLESRILSEIKKLR